MVGQALRGQAALSHTGLPKRLQGGVIDGAEVIKFGLVVVF